MGIQHVLPVGTLDVVVGTQLHNLNIRICGYKHLSRDTQFIVIFELNTIKHEIANSDSLTTSSSYFLDIYHRRFLY